MTRSETVVAAAVGALMIFGLAGCAGSEIRSDLVDGIETAMSNVKYNSSNADYATAGEFVSAATNGMFGEQSLPVWRADGPSFVEVLATGEGRLLTFELREDDAVGLAGYVSYSYKKGISTRSIRVAGCARIQWAGAHSFNLENTGCPEGMLDGMVGVDVEPLNFED